MGRFDYHVSVRRFDQPTAFLVYPLTMRLRLPPLALIPLLPGDPEVTVDLQAVFDRAYDASPIDGKLTYGEDPVIPPFRPYSAKLGPPVNSSGRGDRGSEGLWGT